jgi:hypothetical protein
VTTVPHTDTRSASVTLAHETVSLRRRPGRPSRSWVDSAWILDVEARQWEEDRAIAAAYAQQLRRYPEEAA